MIDLAFTLVVFYGIYMVAARKFKVEHPVLRSIFPYWASLLYKNRKMMPARELAVIVAAAAVLWTAPTIVLAVSQLSNADNFMSRTYSHSWFGLLLTKSTGIGKIASIAHVASSAISATIQITSLNVVGMALCYMGSGLADYSMEIFDAVYSIPAIRSAVSSNDIHYKAKLVVTKKNATDYVISTNALVSQDIFIAMREAMENRISRKFYILGFWRERAGAYVMRIGRLKTVTGTQGIKVSAVSVDDLTPYEGDIRKRHKVVSLGHDGVETVYHDLGIYPFNIIGGVTGSGKTMYAQNIMREMLRVNGRSLFLIGVDIMKGGLNWQLATRNYYEIVGNNRIAQDGSLVISDAEYYRRMQAASVNKNFYLVETEDAFIGLTNFLDKELERRSEFLKKYPGCTSIDEVNDMMLRRDRNFVPFPTLAIVADEWSDMADKYWEGKKNSAVGAAMDKMIGYVSTGRNRGLKIIFMAQRFTIAGQFKSARNQCFFHLGYGVTEAEFDYAINVKASRPPVIQGAFSVVSQTETNRGLGIVCGPKVTNLNFCKAVTDAHLTFYKPYLKWLYECRADLISGCDESAIRKSNKAKFEILEG